MPRASWWETLRQTLQYRDRTLALISDLHRRHGPVVYQRTALVPLVSLFGPDANRFVLLNQQQALSAKGVRFTIAPTPLPEAMGIMAVAFCYDPSGNVVELIEPVAGYRHSDLDEVLKQSQ